MTDILEPLKEALAKGYGLGGGELCIIASRHMEAYIAEIERLRATLQELARHATNSRVISLGTFAKPEGE